MNKSLEACYGDVVDEYVGKVIQICNGMGDGEKLKVEYSFCFE